MRIKELIKIALLTSPIIGTYGIFPLFLFVESAPELNVHFSMLDITKVIFGVGLISSIVFLQWLFNISLIKTMKSLTPFRGQKVLTILLSYIFVITTIWFVDVLREEALNRTDVNFIRFYPFINGVAFNTFILFVIALITSRSKSSKLEIEKAHLEIENVTAKHEQLKHKVHPHFLFNALNTVKVLIKRDPKKAESYVVNLSSFLRSSITETEKDIVTIESELNICTNYLELQKVRFKSAIIFNFDIPDEIVKNSSLPVFTLQSLAENAINHNALTEANPLKIDIVYHNSSGTITFKNNLIPKYSIESSTGTGLENLSNRFKLLIGEDIKITKDEEQEIFEVSFKILRR